MTRIHVNENHIQTSITHVLASYPIVKSVVHDIIESHGHAYLVGGAVRDLMLMRPIKDIDIEIHGLVPAQVEQILNAYGPVSFVGASFGVFRIAGVDIDWSLPRTDSAGRKPDVEINPYLGIEAACMRRDVTMNAMAIDLNTYTLIDPCGGLHDLEISRLRTPRAEFFVQDPLRFFRVMQFIARFDMEPDEELNAICITMDISQVSRERIEQEMNKMLLQSIHPSRGLRWIQSIGRLKEIFPELYALIDVPQEAEWHPEGDVFEHSMQAVDAAARITYDDTRTTLILRYAALCHDLGKAVTTKLHNGRLRSLGHALAGVPIAQALMRRITADKDLIKSISLLVKYHMASVEFVPKKGSHASAAAYKRLAAKLAPYTSIAQLVNLTIADKQGRNPISNEPLTTISDQTITFKEHAERYGVLHAPEPPLLLGKDFLDVAPPGPVIGKLVERAYELQINHAITDKQDLKSRTLQDKKIVTT